MSLQVGIATPGDGDFLLGQQVSYIPVLALIQSCAPDLAQEPIFTKMQRCHPVEFNQTIKIYNILPIR